MNDFSAMDARAFENMLVAGYRALTEREDEVNRLNVFPVPDGDTGGNMCKTYVSGLYALRGASNSGIGDVAARFAHGTLLGARGNSGVILSQIFKGIALGLEGKKEALSADLHAAFLQGVDKSYRAVVKPVEGTILTVFREATESTADCTELSVAEFLKRFTSALEISLKNTPEKLPVLKKAGVIDSGGAGLLYIFNGFLKFFGGETAEYDFAGSETALTHSDDEEEFGYCTEFLLSLSEVKKNSFDINHLIERLESIGGRSIVALRDGDIVKVHVHVDTPGDALNIAQHYGEFMSVKIENMTLQHSELIKSTPAERVAAKERTGVALVAVAGCDGFKDVFYAMGADCVISGGQSMNPSVEDFLKAFGEVNADDVIVLPNNSNVILTANQAGEMFKGSRVHVLETKTLSQGYSALSLYNPDSPVEEIKADLNAAKDSVVSIELTRAIRDAEVDGLKIKKDDYIAVTDGKITAAGKDYAACLSTALSKADLSGKCTATVFVGEDGNADDVSGCFKVYPTLEVNSVVTNQKIYAYIVALE